MKTEMKHKRIPALIVALCMFVTLFISCVAPMEVRAKELSINIARETMLAMKSQYPEGMRWTNDDFYAWKGGYFSGGYGCAGFAFILSDAVFDDIKCTIDYDYTHVRVGDVVRLNDNTHSVIVLKVYENYVVEVAEGNYGGTIHWGRMIDLKDCGFSYLMTRWPAGTYSEEISKLPEPEPEPVYTQITQSMISTIPDCTYTGSEIRPFVSVKNGSQILQEGKDYVLEFHDNIYEGTAVVFVLGRGYYYGYSYRLFNIVADTTPTADISYRTYVQTYGWTPFVKDKSTSGTYAQAKRLESLQVKLTKKDCAGGVSYRTYVQTYGWLPWVSNGANSGTKGESKRLEAMQLKLTGNMSAKYDVYYRVHAQTYGWLGWAKNGAAAGTAGLSKRLEAIQIVLVKKGGKAPGKTTGAYVKKQ